MGRSHFREALRSYETGSQSRMVENALTWFEWFGLKYFKYSQILTNKMAKSPNFKKFAQYFGQEPGPLALGVAEGYLLYKATYPIHVGLQLYGLVKYAQVYNPERLHLS